MGARRQAIRKEQQGAEASVCRHCWAPIYSPAKAPLMAMAARGPKYHVRAALHLFALSRLSSLSNIFLALFFMYSESVRIENRYLLCTAVTDMDILVLVGKLFVLLIPTRIGSAHAKFLFKKWCVRRHSHRPTKVAIPGKDEAHGAGAGARIVNYQGSSESVSYVLDSSEARFLMQLCSRE
jgi:hypothetical protein